MKSILLAIFIFFSSLIYSQKKDTVVLEDITFNTIYQYKDLNQNYPSSVENMNTHVRVLKLPTDTSILIVGDGPGSHTYKIVAQLDHTFGITYHYFMYSAVLGRKQYYIHSTYSSKGFFLRMGISDSEKMTIFALLTNQKEL